MFPPKKKNSVFVDPGPQTATAGKGLPKATHSDILQPELYSGHQQPGPADPGLPKMSHNSVFAAGPQALPYGGKVNGQSGLARRFAGKLGAGPGKVKVKVGFPGAVDRHSRNGM